MSSTTAICNIQDMLERWRTMGSKQLTNGVELVGVAPDDDDIHWMHVVFPGETMASLDLLERQLGMAIPARLRAFYRVCGGLSLFLGAFHLHGKRRPGFVDGPAALQPMGLVELNHDLDILGWRPAGAVAFASNSWDGSVHLVGAGATRDEVVRCERLTGRIIERHLDVFSCVEARLMHFEQLIVD